MKNIKNKLIACVVINLKCIFAYSGGSYEKRAINTQHLPLPGISSISTCGSPFPFNM